VRQQTSSPRALCCLGFFFVARVHRFTAGDSIPRHFHAAVWPDCLIRTPEMPESVAARPDELRNCSADIPEPWSQTPSPPRLHCLKVVVFGDANPLGPRKNCLISNNPRSDNVLQTKHLPIGPLRRAVVLTPLITGLSAFSIWTLAHTDIAAFATIFVAGVVLVFGTFWATGPVTSRQIANPSYPAGRIFRLWR
jgi:hypothetical protein